MKKAFLLAGLLLASARGGDLPSLEKQHATLEKTLWKLQKEYALTDVYIDLYVRKWDEMYGRGNWGTTWKDGLTGLWRIEILAAESYPKQTPAKKITEHQQKTLQHEALHLVLIREGVPEQAQDGLIEAIQPHVRKVR